MAPLGSAPDFRHHRLPFRHSPEQRSAESAEDLQTDKIIQEYPDHSFFWIPLQYWLWIKVFFAVSALAAFLSDHYDI